MIAPHYPKLGNRGHQPYPTETILRVHLMQQRYALSDPAMDEALYDTLGLRQFAHLNLLTDIPDETTILKFRRLLERNALAAKIFTAIKVHLAKHEDAAHGSHRRCDDHQPTDLDQEQQRQARSCDASGEERQPVVLRRLTEELETLKARFRARFWHPFRVLKRQFGFRAVRYHGGDLLN